MIDYKLTPNEKAKLEIYNSIECTLYDGALYANPDMTDREAEATDDAVKMLDQRHRHVIACFYKGELL